MLARSLPKHLFLCLLLAGCVTDGLMPQSGKTYLDAAVSSSEKPAQVASSTPFVPHTHRKLLSSVHSVGILSVPTVDDYLNGVEQRLLAGWSGPKPNIRVYIDPLRGDDAASVEDGAIYLGWDLIEKSDDNMIAAILAHETSHILLKHHDSDIYMTGLRYAALGARLYVRTQSADVVTNVASNQMSNFVVNDISPLWGRTQETEADRMGVDLMLKAGYDISGMSKTMDLIAVAEEQEKIELAEQEKAAKAAKEAKKAERENQTGLAAASDSISETFATTLSDAFSWLSSKQKDHPSAEERKADVRSYYASTYPDGVKGAPRPDKNFKSILASNAVKNIGRDIDQLKAYSGGKTSGTYGLALQSRAVRNSVPELVLRHHFANKKKQDDLAKTLLKREYVPVVVHYNKMLAFIEAKDQKGMIEQARYIKDNYDNLSWAYPDLMRAIDKNPNAKEADKTFAAQIAIDCLTYDSDLAQACQNVVKKNDEKS